MSSLRPLATIALLAAVGVFLYMKINESEPKLPKELDSWSTGDLDVGVGDASAIAASTDSGSAPPAAAGSEAPPFSAANTKPAPIAAPPGDVAPAWTPTPPAANAAAGETVPKVEVDSSPVARSADPPTAVPDMPPLPAMGSTTLPSSPSAVDESASADAAAAPPATEVAATPPVDAAATPPAVDGVPPSTDTASPAAMGSMFPAARVAAQSAAGRGDLGQALVILSEWYGDPSLTPAESSELNDLLSQLAGTVIYDGPPEHRLEAPYVAKAGETLESVAKKYDVPWELLAKINGIVGPGPLPPGQELKVVKGPFSALVDLSERKLTLMLDRRYAGQFALEIDPTVSVEEGQWKVNQKYLTPGGGGIYGAAETEDRSLLLANLANPRGPTVVVRGSGSADPISSEPRGRVLRLKSPDMTDVYDILSEGSRVTIRR